MLVSSRDMYVKTTTRRNKDGTPVRYLHLAHNQWDQAAGRSVPKILYGLGREDQLDRAAIKRLVASLSGLLEPADALAATAWITHDVAIDGLPRTSDDACYRAMDWLLEITDALEKEVFWQVATLLDLEVDLLFFDTTSTYFQLDEPDEPVARDERGRALPAPSDPGAGDGQAKAGFRGYGKSKDHRDDLPQIVIGMAVTRTGIPVRVWCWPGNTTDSALIRQVK